MADTSGLKEFTRAKAQAVAKTTYQAILEEARAIGQRIKAAAPRETGALANSVRLVTNERAARVTIMAGGKPTTVPVRQGQSSTYDYSLGIEFGTQKAGARPFFYPTVRAERPKARRRIRAAIKKEIEKP